MTTVNYEAIFTPERMAELFPKERTDAFFEALFGDVSDGAYDISLAYRKQKENTLFFEFILDQRPGKCLVCSLTYGLPEVFTRHPIINVKGVVEGIHAALGGQSSKWELGPTREVSRSQHVIPLMLELAS